VHADDKCFKTAVNIQRLKENSRGDIALGRVCVGGVSETVCHYKQVEKFKSVWIRRQLWELSVKVSFAMNKG